MQGGIDLYYDEKTGTWKAHEEPFMTLEIPTEEDWNHLQEVLKYWNDHHDAQGNEIK